jgi:N-acetylornithine carbamoyltransferase
MQTHLRGRDVIDFQEWTRDEIDTVLDVAFALKRDRALGRPHPYLEDKVLAMLFFFSSTRTRASFEAGMAQLGGHAQFIESRSTQIAHGDTAKEIGEILGRYNDGIAIRNVDWGVGNAYIREVAEASRVPVLNMQCDHFHPHQALADLMTIIERFGNPRGRTATVSWACAKTYSKPLSVPQSLIMLLPRFGMNVRLVHPPEFALLPEFVEQAKENARLARASFEVMDDFEEGIRGTDVVYAKSWGAVLNAIDETEEARLVAGYESWTTDARRLASASDDAIYMHPLPAERGVEVADEVIDGTRSVVYDQAENRLHGQKAVMALTMS